MGALAILFLGALVAVTLWSWLARGHAGSAGRARRRRDPGAPLGLRSPREIVERREALEAEDLAQMLEASNARRRRRGEAERTVHDLELLVASDHAELGRRREARLAEQDLDELLAATNARRRARGLPERTREQVRREFGARRAGTGPAN